MKYLISLLVAVLFSSISYGQNLLPQRESISEIDGIYFPDTIDKFQEIFGGGEEVIRPFVFRNAAQSWPIMSWTPERLSERFGDLPVTVSFNWNKGSYHDEIPFSEHIVDITRNSKHSGYMVVAASFQNITRLNSTEGMCPLETFEKFISSELVKDCRFPKRDKDGQNVVFLGGESRTAFHNHRAVFLAQIFGTKKVYLIPPQFKNLVYDQWVGRDYDPENPDFERYPKFRGVIMFEAVIHPGDIVYIPNQWYHYVASIGGASLSMVTEASPPSKKPATE